VELLQSHTGNIIGAQAAKPQIKQLQAKSDERNGHEPQTSRKVHSSAETSLTENAPFKGTYEKFAVQSDWLKERGLTPETCKRFGVFEYNNPKRRSAYTGSVMLKIRRYSDGECVGYLSQNTGAITPEKPKYCFPKGFQKHLELFGAWQIKNGLTEAAARPLRVVYVLESPFAVLKFAQLALPAVALFGWSASPEQASILAQLARGCVFLPDRDKFQEAHGVAGLLSQHLWTRTPQLPDGVDDPEQLSAEQIRALTGQA
jgi:hypothetical protein